MRKLEQLGRHVCIWFRNNICAWNGWRGIPVSGADDKEKFPRFPRFISWTGTLFPGVRRSGELLAQRERERGVSLRIEAGAPINLFRILLNAPTFRNAINRFLHSAFPPIRDATSVGHTYCRSNPIDLTPVPAQKRHFISTLRPRCFLKPSRLETGFNSLSLSLSFPFQLEIFSLANNFYSFLLTTSFLFFYFIMIQESGYKF